MEIVLLIKLIIWWGVIMRENNNNNAQSNELPAFGFFENKEGKNLLLFPVVALSPFIEGDNKISKIFALSSDMKGIEESEAINKFLNEYTNQKDITQTYNRGQVKEQWHQQPAFLGTRLEGTKVTLREGTYEKKISATSNVKKRLCELVSNDECSNFYGRFQYWLLSNEAKKNNLDCKEHNYDIGNDFSVMSLFDNHNNDEKVNSLIHCSCSGFNTQNMTGSIFNDYLTQFFNDAGAGEAEHEWLSYYKNYNISRDGKLTTALGNGHIEIWRDRLLEKNCIMGPDDIAYQFLADGQRLLEEGQTPSVTKNLEKSQRKEIIQMLKENRKPSDEQKQKWEDYKFFLQKLLSNYRYTTDMKLNNEDLQKMMDSLNKILEENEDFKAEYESRKVEYNVENQRFEMTINNLSNRRYDATPWLYYMCYKSIIAKMNRNNINPDSHKYDVFNVQNNLDKYGGPAFKNKNKGCKSGFTLIAQEKKFPIQEYEEFFFKKDDRDDGTVKGLNIINGVRRYFGGQTNFSYDAKDKIQNNVLSNNADQSESAVDIDSDLRNLIANMFKPFDKEMAKRNNGLAFLPRGTALPICELYKNQEVMNMYHLVQDFMVAVSILAKTCVREEKEQIILNMHEVESLICKNPKALFPQNENKTSNPVDNIIDCLFADTSFANKDVYRKFVKRFVLKFHESNKDAASMTQFEFLKPKEDGRKYKNGVLAEINGKLCYCVPIQALEGIQGLDFKLDDTVKKLDLINIDDECSLELNTSEWIPLTLENLEQKIQDANQRVNLTENTSNYQSKLNLKKAFATGLILSIIGVLLMLSSLLPIAKFGVLLIVGSISTVAGFVILAVTYFKNKNNSNEQPLNLNNLPNQFQNEQKAPENQNAKDKQNVLPPEQENKNNNLNK